MKRTQQYKLTYNDSGDLYSATADRDRSVVIDNQLLNLSRIVTDGVISGWNISSNSGLQIDVSPGSGFISSIFHKTFSKRTITLQNNATNLVYMQSTMIGQAQGLTVEAESPRSVRASATFIDTIAPRIPTLLSANAVGFDIINLTWAANSESDFLNYEIYRSTASLGPYSLIASPDKNGIIPLYPYQDPKLDASTTYYYKIRAVDRSGNTSGYSSIVSVTTMPDIRFPSEVGQLSVYPSDASISIVYSASSYPNEILQDYKITIDKLSEDGSIASSTAIYNGKFLSYQALGLLNQIKYRITVFARATSAILSNGTSVDAIPSVSSAPLDVTGVVATPSAKSVLLSWTASASPTGSSIGQKSKYLIRVIKDGIVGFPIDAGLTLSRKITSYSSASAVGAGLIQPIKDSTEYVFRISSLDAFGNESQGVYIKAITNDTTAPTDVRTISANALDSEVILQWKHSSSFDTTGYTLFINGGPPVQMGYVQSYKVDGLTNDILSNFVIKAHDKAGNLSTGISISAVPRKDQTAPEIPANIRITARNTEILLTWSKSLAKDFSFFTVRRIAIKESLQVSSGQTLHPVSSDNGNVIDLTRNVGSATEILDTELTNGQTYAYYIKSTDSVGNESSFSSVILCRPALGLSTLPAPENLTALGGTAITLTWDAIIDEHTGYNIYRSSNSVYGFEYIDSVVASINSYTDTTLVGGNKYWYQITAVNDNARVISETGAIIPAHSILLGQVKTSAGAIFTITNAQRLIESMSAAIDDEITTRLLLHRHKIKALNTTTIEAVSLLAMIDGTDIKDAVVDTKILSPKSFAYYESITKDKTKNDILYDHGTTYFISPTSVVWNVPFVGDYQILVNAKIPDIEFSIDASRNAILFPTPLDTASVVTLSGANTTYYVPANAEAAGVDIKVNGVSYSGLTIDRGVQTIRLLSSLGDTDTVSIVVEPFIADYGTQQGSRQVNLSSEFILADFLTNDRILYESQSGAFDHDDVLFVRVNGLRTLMLHAIDTVKKTIVFDTAMLESDVVSLEIRNRQEVGSSPTNVLSPIRIGELDGSQIRTGKIRKAQISLLSHSGRIGEQALPLFSTMTSSNRYLFTGPSPIGTATTPYALYESDSSELFIGTSNGVLRTSGFDAFLAESDSASILSDASGAAASGITFSKTREDDIVKATTASISSSGRFQGSIPITILSGGVLHTVGEISSPNLTFMDDGRILISGGETYNENRGFYFETSACYIYNHTTKAMSRTGDMTTPRVSHGTVRLPNGNILTTGGYASTDLAYDSKTFNVIAATFERKKSCELFDTTSGTWTTLSEMNVKRSNHGCTLRSNGEVVVSGGQIKDTWFDDIAHNNSGPSKQDTSCEIYNISGDTWTLTGALNKPRSNHTAKADLGKIIVENNGLGREIYDRTQEKWTLVGGHSEKTTALIKEGLSLDALDGAVKKFFKDSTGFLYAITRNSIIASADSSIFQKMQGLDSVGVVHTISEINNVLFVATDLGVYTITPDIRNQNTWFQSGLIGAGTTETFDLMPFNGYMYAATEIGIFKSTNGEVWTDIVASVNGIVLGDVYNLEISGSETLFAQSSNRMCRSIDGGVTWEILGTYTFLEKDAKMLARTTLDLFVGSSSGLWHTRDGSEFQLVDFDRNRNVFTNNVTMMYLFGADMFVGYDNEIYAIGPELDSIRLAQFTGTVPTVKINGREIRSGFRYDNQNHNIVFEFKRLSSDNVSVATMYFDFVLSGGEWYSQNPNAAVIVYINNKEIPYLEYTAFPRDGKFSFVSELTKSDKVTVSISNTTLNDVGELFHEELEDRMTIEGSGLPFSMENDRVGNVLQLGLAFEHNLLERGIERNQYYCLTGSDVDRSLTAFLTNAEFFILGRREFDRFNSTIDYKIQSSSDNIGTKALVPLSTFEYSPSELWVGTENGIFVLNATTNLGTSKVVFPSNDTNDVSSIISFNGDVWVATGSGIFSSKDGGATFFRNASGGLPNTTYVLSALPGIAIVGTEDAIYYSNDPDNDGSFGVWFRASFITVLGEEYFENGVCAVMTTGEGIAYAAVDNKVYVTTDGKVWTKGYAFDSSYKITELNRFSKKLYIGTNKGVWTDGGTLLSGAATVTLERIDPIEDNLKFSVNDMFSTNTSMYVVGNSGKVYNVKNESWTNEIVSGATAFHKVFYTSSGKLVTLVNDTVYSE